MYNPEALIEDKRLFDVLIWEVKTKLDEMIKYDGLYPPSAIHLLTDYIADYNYERETENYEPRET